MVSSKWIYYCIERLNISHEFTQLANNEAVRNLGPSDSKAHASWTIQTTFWDAWVAESVKHLPLAQIMIPGSWDGAPCRGSLLSGEPASPSATPPACALFLKYINKIFKKSCFFKDSIILMFFIIKVLRDGCHQDQGARDPSLCLPQRSTIRQLSRNKNTTGSGQESTWKTWTTQ